MITAALVKELREKTGAGMMDCKKALTECDGDIAKSIDWLREKGIAKAAKKNDRIAAEGLTRVGVERQHRSYFRGKTLKRTSLQRTNSSWSCWKQLRMH